ncbi:MAG: NUDIX hydrolase [Chloroflexota bacterium]
MQYVAAFVRKAPWTIALGRVFWRFRQAKFSAGAVGVVFDGQGRVLLVEHVFHPYLPWGLPGGWVDRRESPAETVQRELREELELTVKVGPILMVETEFGNHLDFAYLCYSDGRVGKLSSELLQYDWYDLANLPRLHKFHYQAITSAMEIHKLALQ